MLEMLIMKLSDALCSENYGMNTFLKHPGSHGLLIYRQDLLFASEESGEAFRQEYYHF